MALAGDVRDRYEKKIEECGGIDPYVLMAKDLSEDPKDFPDITVLDIGNYMIQTASPYTKRNFNAYKSTEAYSFFESGFVLSVGSKKTNELAILTGRVKHSQRMNESPLKAWILANMNGTIICAHCNCVAGLSETCSHVAAICFAVSNIGESRETKSVTDMLCKWNMPSFKDVSMSSVKEIHWRYPSQERKTHETNFQKYCHSLTPFTDERIDQFIKKCHADGDSTALGTMILPLEMRRRTNIKDEIFLASLYKVEYKKKTLSELIEIGKTMSLNVTNDEVKEISKITLNKEKSKFFIGLRRGRISGSNFKSCCVTTVENPSLTTLNSMLNPRNLEKVPSIDYQIKNRKKALKQYMTETMSEHENFAYSQCGLIINPNLPYLVGSPDGIISCSCHGEGCLEIKCLKILESGGSFDVLTVEPNNILNKQGDTFVLETSHELFYQVQLQINLIGSEYCDLVLWSPKDLLVLRVEQDLDFWEIAIKKALTFHEQVVMPELLGKFYTKHTDSETNDEKAELQLIGLEIEILQEKQEVIGLEIDILDSDHSDGEEKIEESDGASEGGIHCFPTWEHLSKPQCKLDSKEKTSEEFAFNVSDNRYIDPLTKIGITNARHLKEHSIEDILLTFDEHEDKLKELYDDHSKKVKRSYKAKDLPDMVALDIVNEKQFQEMAVFAESKLANLGEDVDSTGIIFDAILPEWTMSVFCKTFDLTRPEAIEVLKLQSRASIEQIDC